MSDGVGLSPKQWYAQVCSKVGFVSDARQQAVIAELDLLWRQLVEFKAKRNQFLGRSLLSPEVPKGLYLWGGVGRGKTFLMDGFYECLPYRRKRRLHFHEFMVEVHREMQRLAHERDPLLSLADEIERSTRVLCLDEFHVEDIADAMILGRLLQALFERGVVVLTTSNTPPAELYRHGLQRQNFLPAIALLERELRVLHLDSDTDYRMQQMVRDPLFHFPADAGADESMGALYRRLTAGMEVESTSVSIGQRSIPARKVAREVVWFDFQSLCGGHHDQSDYLQLARSFQTIFVSAIPQMTAERAAEARRFTWLIDVLYDHHVKLVASFDVEPGSLFSVEEGDGRRIASRLAEMQTRHYLESPHRTRAINLVGKQG